MTKSIRSQFKRDTVVANRIGTINNRLWFNAKGSPLSISEVVNRVRRFIWNVQIVNSSEYKSIVPLLNPSNTNPHQFRTKLQATNNPIEPNVTIVNNRGTLRVQFKIESAAVAMNLSRLNASKCFYMTVVGNMCMMTFDRPNNFYKTQDHRMAVAKLIKDEEEQKDLDDAAKARTESMMQSVPVPTEATDPIIYIKEAIGHMLSKERNAMRDANRALRTAEEVLIAAKLSQKDAEVAVQAARSELRAATDRAMEALGFTGRGINLSWSPTKT